MIYFNLCPTINSGKRHRCTKLLGSWNCLVLGTDWQKSTPAFGVAKNYPLNNFHEVGIERESPTCLKERKNFLSLWGSIFHLHHSFISWKSLMLSWIQPPKHAISLFVFSQKRWLRFASCLCTVICWILLQYSLTRTSLSFSWDVCVHGHTLSHTHTYRYPLMVAKVKEQQRYCVGRNIPKFRL